MYTSSSSNSINFTINDSNSMDFDSSSFNRSSSILLIIILSILCFCGVIFMIFGPMMRSEAMNRVHNSSVGHNSEHGHQLIDDMGHDEY
ncbi:hypothetical protein I4U23_002121 [Adineta vaga]|nr:hypothetical protein I4U23_002121 [Adineta vaga]